MSELRAEAINLMEKMPEEYLLAIVQYARRFENKNFADEQAMFAEWERDPDTYEDKVAEYVLPVCYCKKCIGFNEDEEYKLRQFVEKNSPLIWEIAREDGEIIADII